MRGRQEERRKAITQEGCRRVQEKKGHNARGKQKGAGCIIEQERKTEEDKKEAEKEKEKKEADKILEVFSVSHPYSASRGSLAGCIAGQEGKTARDKKEADIIVRCSDGKNWFFQV